jgi:hypothetical protein
MVQIRIRDHRPPAVAIGVPDVRVVGRESVDLFVRPMALLQSALAFCQDIRP